VLTGKPGYNLLAGKLEAKVHQKLLDSRFSSSNSG